ncbi:hypothetical protein SI859A1_02146 [Aurantimonas manganoxydans SI85-9A1]|uniref:Uncharacterized protein n=1 Tax=Aurantimonas manganoxydans (strain ATCC BAA-1229 / DSM 21871 / SI85-9A1) TaxID=287752 RepID=Q1YMQ0_AURMS|nr:hypothetical protein SI859A1_02146 [Aurantimonas manganoxydans SI85-9A1]
MWCLRKAAQVHAGLASKLGKKASTNLGAIHGSQDRITQAGRGEEVMKALMGHAETGMTKRYGTKKAPRPVDIVKLNDVIQSLPWPFLQNVRAGNSASESAPTQATRGSKPSTARDRAAPVRKELCAEKAHQCE